MIRRMEYDMYRYLMRWLPGIKVVRLMESLSDIGWLRFKTIVEDQMRSRAD